MKPWSDLRGRLAGAAAKLTTLTSETSDRTEYHRLLGKRQGVALAISYMNEYPVQHEVGAGVAALIVRPAGDVAGLAYDELLMIQRGPGSSHGAGTWSVPGGWVDYGESLTTAVAREVLEEVGLNVVVDTRASGVTNVCFEAAKMHSVCAFFHAAIVGHDTPVITEPDKVAAVEWVPLPEVGDRELFAHLAIYHADHPEEFSA